MGGRQVALLLLAVCLLSGCVVDSSKQSGKKSSKSVYTIKGALLGLSPAEQADSSAVLVGSHAFFQSVPIRSDGSFLFADVPPGSYSLSVLSPHAFFDRLKVVCSHGAVAATSELSGAAVDHPLRLAPLSRAVFEERAEFDFRSLLTNPMVMMLGFGLLTFVMTKMSSQQKEMLAELTPEERAEVPAFFQALLPKQKTATDLEDEVHFSPLVRRNSQSRITNSPKSS